MTDQIPNQKKAVVTRELKYVTIRNWLAEQISNGKYARGERIPSEHELMAQFDVSRVTARQALTELRNAGIVEAKRGKGYYVRRFTATSSLERLQGFSEMLAPLGVETHSDIIELLEIPAGPVVSRALKIEPGTFVTRLARTRHAGGAVLSLGIDVLPINLGRRLMSLDLEHRDIFDLMENQLGIEISYADVKLEVTPIADHHADQLGVATGAPVLCMTRVTFNAKGEPQSHERIYSRVESMQYEIRVPRW